MAFSDWSNDKKKKKYNSFSEYSNAQKGIVEEDIAPIKTSGQKALDRAHSRREEEEEKRTFFQSGALDDGEGIVGVGKAIGGTISDVAEDIVKGGGSFLERTWDGLMSLGAAMNRSSMNQAAESEIIYNALSGKKEAANQVLDRYNTYQDQVEKETLDYVEKNLIDEEQIAKAIITDNVKRIGIDVEEDSVLGERSDELVQSATDVALRKAVSLIPGVGTGLSLTLTGASVLGGEVENAAKQDATFDEAILSGMISAGAEMGTEYMFGGIKFGGKTLTEGAANRLASTIKSKTLATLAKWGFNTAGEGFEEVASGWLSAVGQNLTYADEKELGELFTWGDAWDNFVSGALLGGLFEGVSIKSASKHNVDYVSGLKKDERKVVDKVYNDAIAEAEKSGKKLTTKEKTKIFDDVVGQAKKGYISTDTIEEVLGGESYKAYKSAFDSENTMKSEFDELNKMKQGEMTGEQIDRRLELKQQLEELKNNKTTETLKNKLSNEVFGLVKDSKLAESYNEKGRRGQYFEADLSNYDNKYRDIVQKAIDSKTLNNTNRTHELVDMIAKISADKGVSFDFTNNAKLKETGFAIDGTTINGYVTKDGITLNTDSAKYLNSVVGHEVTHVLEGTELYQELQNTLIEYAKTKNDYQGRLDSLTALYKDVEGADINAELTADLVGDYLFSDSDFISKLSTEHRNVFQKIYDEIKYLYKVATAGSKEARELEKVKRAFDKAYKESGKVTGTKYSMTADNTGKQLTKEQQEYFKDSKMRDENGNLKVMYHGSQNAGFHVFDSKMSDDDTSFFFVDRNDVAASYSGTSETYEAQTIHTAEDMNNFIQSIGVEGYEVVEKDGKFTLLYEGDRVADSNTAQGIYDEFCWYEGVGEGDANYKVYLNLKNPLIVDAKGRPWNKIDAEFSQEVYDKYQSLTAEEKAALVDLAEWEDFRVFNSEIQEAKDGELASAYKKMGEDINIYDLFSVAADNFSEESMRENARNYLKTRDYAQRAKEQGYDGVILNNVIDNGGYSNGDEGASNVAIAFSPEQIKSVANTKPTTDPDIRYSLSADSNGNELSPAVQKRFANSKAVDENGDLKVLYHGTATGEFSIFDKAKGNVEGDFGSGFYFTDNEADVSEHYEGGGPDFDIKVDRRAEQIYNEALDEGNEITYKEAEKRAREELYKGSHKFEVYLNIENPAVVGETNLLEQDKYLEEYNEEDYDDYDEYIADVEQLVADDIEGIVWEIENNVDVDKTDGIAEVLYEAYYEGGIGVEELKTKINNLYLEDSEGNLVGNEVTRQIIESLGYDGIIDPTVAGKWNMDIEPGTTHYIAFKPNQIKSISNANPTDSPDIHRSLSRVGEQPKKYGNLHIKGEDVAYQGIAPIKKTVTENVLPDDFAPMTEQDAAELQRESLASIDEADMPPESNTEYYDIPDNTRLDEKAEKSLVNTLNGILNLDGREKAVMREVVQKYSTGEMQTDAELFDEIKKQFGERTWTTKDDVAAEVKKYLRTTKVKVSDTIKGDIADYNRFRLKNCWGKVRVNKEGVPVDSLYMELSELYPNFFPEDITNPTEQFLRMVDVANTDYDTVEGYKLEDAEIQAVANIISSEIGRYKETELMKSAEADRKAFMSDIAQGKVMAPIRETDTAQTENKVAKTENVEAPAKEEKIAKLLAPKTEAPKEKSRTFMQARMLFGDRQAPIEDLALKTGNRELMAKADALHRAEGRAQRFIGKGADGVRALLDIKAETEKAGLYEEFKEYMTDMLNVDRMSIESNAKKKIDSLQGKFGNLKSEQIHAIAAKEITKKTTARTAQTIREAREYLKATDAHNKAVYGESVTADISRAKAEKAEALHPQFKQWAKDVYGITEHLRKEMVDGGVISQELSDTLAEMYPHYIPIKRDGKDGAAINVPLDTRKTGVNTPIKRATGGNSDIVDMWETLSSRIEQTYKAVAKNSLGIELKNTLGAEGIKNSATFDEINENFDNYEELLKKGENGMNPTFTIFENGERVEFEINEDLYDALKPKNDFLAKKIKPLNTVMKIQRGLLTEYNLLFSATNAFKDAQSVFVNSQHPVETYTSVPEALKELTVNAFTGKEGKYLQEYFEHGGEDITYFDGKNKLFAKEDSGIKKVLGFVPRKISEVNNFIEKIPRLAEYIASRKKGASVDVAMLDAARVTTNFAAGGDVTKFLNDNGFTFLNASVEGFNQQVRNVREAKTKGLKGMLQLAAKYAVAGLPVMLFNGLMWDDDEEYEELSDYIKDNYYIVGKTQDGKFIRIPKGREVAVIQNAFEQMKNLITGDDKVDMFRFGELLVENIAPNNPLTNNIFAPIYQAHTNQTWYGGDLVPTRLQDLPDAEQYDESTDAISKWLGENTGLSPYRLNYLLDQYSGAIGDVLLPMLTPETDGGGILAPWQDKFTTNSTMKNQNVTDFYTTKDELTTNAKSSNATDEDILKSKYINSVNTDMSELYQRKREIQNSSLSDKEKDKQVKAIQEQINAMAKESLNTYNNVSIDDGYATVGDLHYKLNKEGEWEKVTDKQFEKQEDVTSGLGISASEYWSNKEEYDYAYESPEKYAVAKAVGGYDTYKTYSSELYDIKADKDSSGKSISGSRKEKVVEYINNLDADYGEKIILFKSEYNADDTYNYEIVDYLNSRDDISYSEMETILKELGFNVSADGTVSWD